VKTHKLTIFLNAEGTTTISDLKQQTLEALNAPVLAHHEDFENEVKNRTQPHVGGRSNSEGLTGSMNDDDDLQLDKGDVDLAMDLDGELGAGMHAGGEMGIGMGTSLHANPKDLVDSIPRPLVRELGDFELCRGVRDRTTMNDARYTHQMTGIAPLPESFSVLDASKTASELKLNNWETLYVQYREAGSGTQALATS
jgi:hypothetical protein